MSQLKLTADSGGGTVAIKAPASTTGNAAFELTVPGTGNRGLGKILQVLQTVKTDTSSTTAVNSFEDISGMSIAITPSSTSSKVLVMVDMRLSTNTNRNITYRLMRGSTVIYVGDSAGSRTQATGSMRLTDDAKYDMQSETAIFLDSPSTTSATTYKVQWTQTYSSSGESMYINRSYVDNDVDDRNRCASSITVQEVAA
ncbi:tail fiber protein [Prochlorococcus phage P-SSP7]|uniref:Uncharacterized protein n=1 Tax=Prochlorococcus phage P-SSP7 TaxID=2908095 RepID=Q58N21_BPPRP|nr:tail fiber protein [Prochlorococcus phage P-SSP7]AAX44217.1 uncharacterized protein PSSP7_038 [Prochlorococcus phage P-SSP7]